MENSPSSHRPANHRSRLLRFAPWAYLLGSVALIPWTIYLAVTLPMHYETPHYKGTWVIFDVGLAIALAFVGWYGRKRDIRVVIAASVAASLLFADAWFDVSSAHGSDDHLQAVLLAVFLEIPGGILCLRIARRTLLRVAERGSLEAEHERVPEHLDEKGLTSSL